VGLRYPDGLGLETLLPRGSAFEKLAHWIEGAGHKMDDKTLKSVIGLVFLPLDMLQLALL